MTLEQQVRRWQFVALIAVALLVGYVVGTFAPRATAQAGVMKVQLDTSNCVVGISRISSEREGAFVVQVSPSSVQGINDYVFNTCR